MLFEIISLLLGILTGIITGLTPGIHTNLVMGILLSTSFFMKEIPPQILVIYITAAAITHTFLDFIPSVYLGAPSEDTVLSTLPGHKYLLNGNAHIAIKLTAIGSLLSIFLMLISIPFFFFVVPIFYDFIEKIMGWILILTLIFLIRTETYSKKWAIIVIIMSGFLGIITLNSNINQPLLPLLTGFFGVSTIIHSIKSKTKLPPQNTEDIKINKKELLMPSFLTTLVSPICSFLPGLGSSQAAIIASELNPKQTQNQFLILFGSINTFVLSSSFVTLYLFNKKRSGVVAAISEIMQLNNNEFIMILIAIIISSILAYFITIKISKIFAKNITKINYTKISYLILILLIIITIFVSGISGLLVLTTSTILGLFTINIGIRKSHLMASILIPTILYYLPFF